MRGREPQGKRIEFVVAGDAAARRLDAWLAGQLPDLGRNRAKQLILEGHVAIGGRTIVEAKRPVKPGEIVVVDVPPPVAAEPEAEAIPLDVVYEDAHLIVVDKPAGLVVHPAPGAWTGTLVNALIHHCGASLSGIGGVARPGVVHRIDKDTSGLLVVAKTDAAHQSLSAAFSAHDIERVYEAVAVGAPRPGVGTVNAALARKRHDRTKMAVVDEFEWDEDAEDYAPRQGARRAVTHYRVAETFGRGRAKLTGEPIASLISCTLETGRTHQIRVHLATIGCPLIGDQTYGRGPGLSGLKPGEAAADHAIDTIRNFRRQALHAKVLGFIHPVTGEAMRFERAAPADFQALLAALRAL